MQPAVITGADQIMTYQPTLGVYPKPAALVCTEPTTHGMGRLASLPVP
jgi:hypothetical protein